jgi:hypothetical protein
MIDQGKLHFVKPSQYLHDRAANVLNQRHRFPEIESLNIVAVIDQDEKEIVTRARIRCEWLELEYSKNPDLTDSNLCGASAPPSRLSKSIDKG